MKKLILIIILLPMALVSEDLCKYVDPFIGTGGHGHTYPGASLPFGMVQLSPDTRLTGWDGCSAYHYTDSIVYGFSHTHLSGTGCSDYGDVLLMPTSGEYQINNNQYCSVFSHSKEKAEAGYYSVFLEKYGILAELTVSRRTGFHRYSYNNGKSKNLLLDLKHRDESIECSVELVNDTLIRGYRRSKAWAKDQTVYFAIRLSSPISKFVIYKDMLPLPSGSSAKGKNIQLIVSFRDDSPKTISAKVGISAVSESGALNNADTEIKDWNFEKVKKDARIEWNKELNKIRVEGGTETQKKVFYTSLYHCLLNPNLFMDADGKYRGRDNKIHAAENFEYYTVFSLWDTYRAEHPLLTIIDRKRTNDFINTFLRQYKEGKLLPVWELWSNETYCMIGYHAVPVIADAMLKGILDYDKELALEACIKSAEMNHFGLGPYRQNLCMQAEDDGESVSKTLEYAYDDWCIAQMAKFLKKDSIYNVYIKRAQSYKNLFDTKTGFIRARLNGSWYEPFDPREVNNHFTEANCWQYSFYVPQDVSGFMELLGGKSKLEEKLDSLFSASSIMTGRDQSDISGIIGQYAHGNEPSHHIAYLYDYCGAPWKTQQMASKIMNELYTDSTNGLCGNEDCGQMSAWYVMSALGIYPLCPGSSEYALGTPLFDKAVIAQENGKEFVISLKRKSGSDIYIQSAELNGDNYDKCFITHDEIVNGGNLNLEMGSTPNKSWAIGPNSLPKTGIEDDSFVTMPIIKGEARTFRERNLIFIEAGAGTEIYYSLEKQSEKNWQKYTAPFFISESGTIFAKAVGSKGESSVSVAKFYKLEGNLSISIKQKPSRQYTAGGPEALIDGIRGKENFRLGDWQGYDGTDFEAVLNLGGEMELWKVTAGFLQDFRSWIHVPQFVEIYVSDDGINFTQFDKISNDISDRDFKILIKDFTFDMKGKKSKYIKVFAKNYGVLPDWHEGAGGKSFIFVDEISVK